MGGLLKQLRLALFTDVGGIDETRASPSGVRVSPGIGLRLTQGTTTLELNNAFALGDTRGMRRARFYFTITTETGL